MNFFIQTLKTMTLFILLFLALGTYSAHAKGNYTYDSPFDPAQLFEYTLIDMKDIGGGRRALLLKSTEHYPRYVVNIVALTAYRKVLILAYAFYNKNLKVQNYILKQGHYVEKKLSGGNLIFVKECLNTLMQGEI